MKCKDTSSAVGRACAARARHESRDVQGVLLGREWGVRGMGMCGAALQSSWVPEVGLLVTLSSRDPLLS